ncbi:MAG: ribosome silencing factor [Bacteroidales bacterium]|nr:ribosome silencing factor [Bacteroidales bacterium]
MGKNVLKVITDAMLEKKGQNVVSLDLSPIGTAISDYFVVCNADSTTAVAAIADNVIVRMEEKCERKVLRMQGLENDFWIILDYGDVVVHILHKDERETYAIEKFWNHAFSVPESEWKEISEEYKTY